MKLTVAYDGTCYHGFQVQAGKELPTVQGVLEEAWRRLVGERVRVNGAGRTDAGVHARGQVASFVTASRSIPTRKVPLAMNSVLPEDVVVVGCEEVPASFHARFSARGKRYRYTVLNQPFPSPFDRRYAHFVPQALDVAAMAEAARHFVGTRDFAAVSGNNGGGRSTVRTVTDCSVTKSGPYVWVDVAADGFLYHMARRIAGTLLVVGRGERPAEWVREALERGDPCHAGPTLPAHGLCLLEVYYD